MKNQDIMQLRELASTSGSCIKKIDKKLQVLVQPCYFSNVIQGIQAAMTNLTVGYCKR